MSRALSVTLVILISQTTVPGATPLGAQPPTTPPTNKAYPVRSKDKLCGYITPTGQLVIAPVLRYSLCAPFSESLALVGKGSRHTLYGFIGPAGEEIIKPQFKQATSFSMGLAAVRQGGRWGFIDKTGSFVIKLRFTAATPFNEGLAAVKLGRRWGYIDRAGKWVIRARFSNARPFSDGLAAVRPAQKFGFIDKTGKLVVSAKYAQVRDFAEGYAFVEERAENGAGCFIDKSGAVAYQLQHPQSIAGSFSEGLAPVAIGDYYVSPCTKGFKCSRPKPLLYGYLNKAWKVTIDYQYDIVYPFREGLALGINFQLDRTVVGDYLIDHQGRIRFSIARPYRLVRGNRQYEDGLLQIYLDDTLTYLNRQGKPVWTEK